MAAVSASSSLLLLPPSSSCSTVSTNPSSPPPALPPRAPPAALPISAPIVTPIVPVLVEDDWKAALLWKALYEAGVFVNVAVHPAVPPGGALLRTSVMATHGAETIERALDTFSEVKRTFEAEHSQIGRAHV